MTGIHWKNRINRITLILKNRTNRRLNVILGVLGLLFVSLYCFPTLNFIGGDGSTSNILDGLHGSEYSGANGGSKFPPASFNDIGNLKGYFPNKQIKNPHDFYYKLFSSLSKSRPVNPPKDKAYYRTGSCSLKDIASYQDKNDFTLLSKNELTECYSLSEQQIDNLRSAHTKFMNYINNDLANIDDSVRNKIWPNDKGIVIVGGSKFSIVSVTTIKALRDRGTTLPIEVIIPPNSVREDEYCNKFLPQFNAKCKYFEDLMPKEFSKGLPLKKYQYKALAILMSTFKNVFYLDADNIPLVNLDNIFNTKAYKDNGMILWPDIWRRVTAPAYYDIANITYNLDKRVRYMSDDITPVSHYDNVQDPGNDYQTRRIPLHDFEGTLPDLTTESGQLLINKQTHLKSLLLTFYYNFYGPKWYYRLFSQGTSGEGDKETFIAAATVTGESYYQVKTNLAFDGYFDHKDGFQGIGLYQMDFEQDYKNYLAAKAEIAKHSEEYRAYNPNYDFVEDFQKKLMNPPGKEVQPMFVHVSFNKLDPHHMSKTQKYILQGKNYRVFSNFKALHNWDLELDTTSTLYHYFCTDNSIEFPYYRHVIGKPSWKKMCAYLLERKTYLEETHDDAVSGKMKITQPEYIEETKKEEPKKEEAKKEEPKKEEPKKEEPKKEEPKKEEAKKEEPKKEEPKKEEAKKEEPKKEEPKKEEPKKEEPKKEEPKKEEPKREEPKKEEAKKEEPKKEEPKKEEPKKEEPKKEEPKKAEANKEEAKK